MTTTYEQREYFELTTGYWVSHVVAGIVAGVVMGVVMHQVMGMIQLVGALYGQEATTSGWLFHLWHAVVFAVIFGAFFLWRRLSIFRDRILASVALGIIWGLVLWFLAAGVVMPAWLGTVSVRSPAIPTLDPWSGLGHVLYGGVLGGVAAGVQKAT